MLDSTKALKKYLNNFKVIKLLLLIYSGSFVGRISINLSVPVGFIIQFGGIMYRLLLNLPHYHQHFCTTVQYNKMKGSLQCARSPAFTGMLFIRPLGTSSAHTPSI